MICFPQDLRSGPSSLGKHSRVITLQKKAIDLKQNHHVQLLQNTIIAVISGALEEL